MRFLIVNADDFGQSPCINQAVALAACEGILTSATLMANGNAFDDAVTIAKQVPVLGVGVHLNLVEGKPVLAGPSSLVNAEGDFRGKFGLVQQHVTGRLKIDDVRREVSAQISKVIDAGLKPTHVDSHQHLHVYPPLLTTVLEVAREWNVSAVRLPVDRWRLRDLRFAPPAALLRASVINAAAARGRQAIEAAKMRTTDYFAGTLLTGNVSAAWLRLWLGRLQPGVTELMVHPGVASQVAWKTRLRNREKELAALVDPEILTLVREASVQLVHYGHLS